MLAEASERSAQRALDVYTRVQTPPSSLDPHGPSRMHDCCSWASESSRAQTLGRAALICASWVRRLMAEELQSVSLDARAGPKHVTAASRLHVSARRTDPCLLQRKCADHNLQLRMPTHAARCALPALQGTPQAHQIAPHQVKRSRREQPHTKRPCVHITRMQNLQPL